MVERRNLHVRLSPDSYEGWLAFAAAAGVSLGSLVEAIGLQMREDPSPVTDRGRRTVEQARSIDRDHRSRRGG